MKKMLFGLGLLLSGIIGFTGWCAAAVQKAQPGAVSRIFGCIDGEEWIVLLFFAAMALAGLVISVLEYGKGDDQQ